ncbi:MAG: tetratricopeptide repeat protein [Candidatus Aquicultor sp.]
MGYRGKPSISRTKTLVIAAAVALVAIIGITGFLGGCGSKGKDETKLSSADIAKAKKNGTQLYQQGKLDQAIPELKKAVEGDPKDMQVQFQLGYAYERKGRLDDAYKQYGEILKVNKGSADAHYNVGRILVQKKQLDKAITEFETAAKMNPNFTADYAALADAYTQKKEFSKALATYDGLAKIIGSSDSLYLARIHSSKGLIYRQLGQSVNARSEFEQALKLDKNNKEAIAGLK